MKKFLLNLAIILIISLLTACGGKEKAEDSFNIMFLSDLPPNFAERVTELITPQLQEEELQMNVSLFPISFEKLTIEVVAKNTDIFIVDESLMTVLSDPVGLHPLDSIVDLTDKSMIDEKYILYNEETEEAHLYAIPLDNNSKLAEELGIQLPSSLIAVITSSSFHKDTGLKILRELM